MGSLRASGLLLAFIALLVSLSLDTLATSVEGASQVASSSRSMSDRVDCCVPPYSYFNCSGSGHMTAPEKLYTCVSTANLYGCMTCLESGDASELTCASCCSLEADADCKSLRNSDWEFYLSSVFFVCLCCCFSALCGFTEVQRKKRGISFAEAWSIPQAMPILRTWPRRSVSVSDALAGLEGEGEGEGWTPLSDDEEDRKKYPVAGLVDDSGVAFGFVTSMPQSLLGSVSATLRRQNRTPPFPLVATEPELTVWISREGASSTNSASAPERSAVEATRGQVGTEQAVAIGGRDAAAPGSDGSSNDDVRRGRGRAGANSLHEPLILEDAGVRVRSGEGGESQGAEGTGGRGAEERLEGVETGDGR